MIKYNKFCPICGYDLGFLPWDYGSPSFEICPSCGIQCGYSDASGGSEDMRIQLYKDWRKDWIDNGSKWQSSRECPEDWNPQKQLQNIPKELI
jgi:hypothetical protein